MRVPPLPPLLLRLPMLLTLLLRPPWLALGALPCLALGTQQGQTCRLPQGLALLPQAPPARGLPANNNEASTLSHFWYGMFQASQRSRQSCMRHGHTLHNLMLLCSQKPRLLPPCTSSSRTT